MKREIVRVEPISTYLERFAPTSAVTCSKDMVFVSGMPPYDRETGEIVANAPIERQAEIVLEQLKMCVEAAGSSLDQILKCNVYCTSVEKFAKVNEVYRRYFPKDPPARVFVVVQPWAGPFDVEIDCIAMR